ncbi:hypothetical protein KC368_g9 [Hortaea werneckii]|nr:hypothetical protein KC368_g9 [Hortaea werneckii]
MLMTAHALFMLKGMARSSIAKDSWCMPVALILCSPGRTVIEPSQMVASENHLMIVSPILEMRIQDEVAVANAPTNQSKSANVEDMSREKYRRSLSAAACTLRMTLNSSSRLCAGESDGSALKSAVAK